MHRLQVDVEVIIHHLKADKKASTIQVLVEVYIQKGPKVVQDENLQKNAFFEHGISVSG